MMCKATAFTPEIEGRLEGSFSVRFPSVLGEHERGELSASLDSHDARIASWKPYTLLGRTYARVDYAATSAAAIVCGRWPEARIDDPPLVVLEVGALGPAAARRLAAALGGPAGPLGVTSVDQTPFGVLIELDDARTPLALVVDLIDVELCGAAPQRAIRPLIGLSDRTLARMAGAVLGAAEFDETRLIETYSEPLLRGPAP